MTTQSAVVAQMQTTSFIMGQTRNREINRQMSLLGGDRKVLARIDLERYNAGADISTMCDEAKRIIEAVGNVE